MTTATASDSIEALEARLAEQEREVEEAEKALGAAELEGKGGQATKKHTTAVAALKRTRAALDVLRDRHSEVAERERLIAAIEDRAATYRWCADYFAAAEKVVRSQAAAYEALVQFHSIQKPRGRMRQWHGSIRSVTWSPLLGIEEFEGKGSVEVLQRRGVDEFDSEFIGNTKDQVPEPNPHDFELFRGKQLQTPEGCRELRDRAIALAEADEARAAELREEQA